MFDIEERGKRFSQRVPTSTWSAGWRAGPGQTSSSGWRTWVNSDWDKWTENPIWRVWYFITLSNLWLPSIVFTQLDIFTVQSVSNWNGQPGLTFSLDQIDTQQCRGRVGERIYLDLVNTFIQEIVFSFSRILRFYLHSLHCTGCWLVKIM